MNDEITFKRPDDSEFTRNSSFVPRPGDAVIGPDVGIWAVADVFFDVGSDRGDGVEACIELEPRNDDPNA